MIQSINSKVGAELLEEYGDIAVTFLLKVYPSYHRAASSKSIPYFSHKSLTSSSNSKVGAELLEEYRDIAVKTKEALPELLSYIYSKTKEKFVFIIDEWLPPWIYQNALDG